MAMDQYISTWNISFLGIFTILWPWINTYQYGTYVFWGYSPYYGHGSIHINTYQHGTYHNISFLEIFAITKRPLAMDQYHIIPDLGE
jgi:hypothetical protein